MLSFEFFSYDETRSSIPLPLIEATCNHAQEPLLLPNGRATIPQEIFPIPISISKISFDKPSPNNSMKFPAIPLVQKIRQDLDHGCRIATNLLLAAGFEGWSPIQELTLRDLIIIINAILDNNVQEALFPLQQNLGETRNAILLIPSFSLMTLNHPKNWLTNLASCILNAEKSIFNWKYQALMMKVAAKHKRSMCRWRHEWRVMKWPLGSRHNNYQKPMLTDQAMYEI